MVNLNEVPTYIPKAHPGKTDEQYCRAELARLLLWTNFRKRGQDTPITFKR